MPEVQVMHNIDVLENNKRGSSTSPLRLYCIPLSLWSHSDRILDAVYAP